ncbi:hypothetical protein AVHM3334_22875 [Acidovorax sp. SUPP3334]|nr:hypothetical protein AVHM3334_22875 [Acidovorax sp. SUPP3334]
MSETDFLRQPLAEMIDPHHPLAVLAARLPWAQIEAALAPHFARHVREGRAVAQDDLFGPSLPSGRCRCCCRRPSPSSPAPDGQPAVPQARVQAKQFKRLRKVVKRQRTILGIVLREVGRKIEQASEATALTLTSLQTLMQRAERIRTQRPKDKNKLYALHAPQVECIGKGKARKPYEFGVKVSVAVTHKQGLMVGARSFTGNPYDGNTLNEQLEQVRILIEDTAIKPQADRRGPGVQRCGCGQPRRADHPPRQIQEPDRTAATLAQAQTGGGARHRAAEARQRHGPVLVAGRCGRCAACAAVRDGLQHPLAAIDVARGGGPATLADRPARPVA